MYSSSTAPISGLSTRSCGCLPAGNCPHLMRWSCAAGLLLCILQCPWRADFFGIIQFAGKKVTMKLISAWNAKLASPSTSYCDVCLPTCSKCYSDVFLAAAWIWLFSCRQPYWLVELTVHSELWLQFYKLLKIHDYCKLSYFCSERTKWWYT